MSEATKKDERRVADSLAKAQRDAEMVKARIESARRDAPVSDEALQRLRSEFAEAGKTYKATDPRELASRFTDAFFEVSKETYALRFVNFSESMNDTLLGVLAQTAIAADVLYMNQEKTASAEEKIFGDRLLSYFFEMFGDPAISAAVAKEVVRQCKEDKEVLTFSSAVLAAFLGVEERSYRSVSRIFEIESEGLKGNEEYKDPSSKARDKAEIYKGLAYDSKKKADALGDEMMESFKRNPALRGGKANDAVEWLDSFLDAIDEELERKIEGPAPGKNQENA